MSKSKAISLLTTVWEYGQKDSWERINHSMRNALSLAIGSGLKFGLNDFHYMSQNFRTGYWFSADPEWIYTEAVVVGNTSCVEAWEHFKNRIPFRANSVSTRNGCDGGYIHANSVTRKRERLAIGMSFPFDGWTWHVTNFNDIKTTVRICRYAKHYPDGAPTKRMELTHDDIKVMFPCPKKTKCEQSAEQPQ